MVNVSVVICTYNRAESLRDALESLEKQNVNNLNYEIIVVDNNSKDHTKRIVEEFQGRNGRDIRYVFEPKQGVAYARNSGIRNSNGEIIAYLDDDVIVDSNWLESLWKCFQETKADAVGGRILRKWNADQPEWFSEEIGGCLISQALGGERFRCNSVRRHMVTANLAFRRNIFKQFRIFREELGRRGEELVGGEDREFYQRLLKEGSSVFYEPKALVFHKVEPERLTKEYFRKWFWQVGQTLGHEIQWKWYYLFTIAPIWLWKEWCRAIFRYVKFQSYPVAKENERFASHMWVVHYGGMFLERLAHWFPYVGKSKCVFYQGGK